MDKILPEINKPEENNSGLDMRDRIRQEIKDIKKVKHSPFKRELLKEKKRLERASRVPSEKSISKNVKKYARPLVKKKENTLLRSLLRLSVYLLLIILITILLTSETVWTKINDLRHVNYTDRVYFFDSCSVIGSSTCTFQIHRDSSIFNVDLGNNRLENISFPPCKTIDVQPNNSALLSDCSFSSLSNFISFDITYINPDSGLTHVEKASVLKSYEITSITHLSTTTENKITAFFVGLNLTR